VAPGWPGCLPGCRRPRSRSDRSRRFFRYGLSDDGGCHDTDESRRACRSSSSTPRLQPASLDGQLPDQGVRLSQPGCQLTVRQRGQLLRRGNTGHIGRSTQINAIAGPWSTTPPRRVATTRPALPQTRQARHPRRLLNSYAARHAGHTEPAVGTFRLRGKS
jgi:hypothetical protein